MKVIVLLLIVLCGLLGSYITRAGWTDWRDITLCNAKPCPCDGYKDKCQPGKKVQVRMCEIDPNNATDNCDFDDEVGFFRRTDCNNNATTCPGWSDWEYPEDECHRLDEDNDTSSCIIIPKRYCNNPPPIHEDIICFSGAEQKHQMTEKNLYDERNCTCPVEPEVQEEEEPVFNEYDDYGKKVESNDDYNYEYNDYGGGDYGGDGDDDNKDENDDNENQNGDGKGADDNDVENNNDENNGGNGEAADNNDDEDFDDDFY